MNIGKATGCHQLPSRSLFIKGHQLPLCARCTGIALGQPIAIAFWFVFHTPLILSGMLCLPLIYDGLIQAMGVWESTNRRRMVTGILCGYGMMTIYIYGLNWFWNLFHH